MSSRLDKSWKVLVSHQTVDASRCVDVFLRPDGTFGYEEFRRDPEDLGVWTPLAFYSGQEFPTADAALDAAKRAVAWLGDVVA
jgi:hypothetical protein